MLPYRWQPLKESREELCVRHPSGPNPRGQHPTPRSAPNPAVGQEFYVRRPSNARKKTARGPT